MRAAIHLLTFGLALLADATRTFELPWISGRPLFFIALATVHALRANALTGGGWGFGGGFALGLLYADRRLGPMALGGLVAGSVPSAFRGLLFWQRWTGQAALGALAGLLYGGILLGAALVRGEVDAPLAGLLPRWLLDGALTGLACPVLYRLVNRLDRLA